MADAVDDFTVSGEAPNSAEETPAELPGPDSDPEPEPEPDEDTDTAASEAGKTLAAKRKSYKQVILEKTVNEKAAQRERDDAKAEAARLKAELAAKPAAEDKAPAAPQFLTRPKPSTDEIGGKYADWEAYNDDLIEWRIDERDAKKARETDAAQRESNERQIVAKVQERIAAFKAEHEDYDSVVAAALIPDGSPSYMAIMNHLRYSELGPQLAYELGKNQTELTRIAGLAPGFAVAALGRLEGTIDTRDAAAKSGTAHPVAVTKAKPPIKPVGSSPVTSDESDDLDDLSPGAVDKHIARENAKDREFRLAGRRR